MFYVYKNIHLFEVKHVIVFEKWYIKKKKIENNWLSLISSSLHFTEMSLKTLAVQGKSVFFAPLENSGDKLTAGPR